MVRLENVPFWSVSFSEALSPAAQEEPTTYFPKAINSYFQNTV